MNKKNLALTILLLSPFVTVAEDIQNITVPPVASVETDQAGIQSPVVGYGIPTWQALKNDKLVMASFALACTLVGIVIGSAFCEENELIIDEETN